MLYNQQLVVLTHELIYCIWTVSLLGEKLLWNRTFSLIRLSQTFVPKDLVSNGEGNGWTCVKSFPQPMDHDPVQWFPWCMDVSDLSRLPWIMDIYCTFQSYPGHFLYLSRLYWIFPGPNWLDSSDVCICVTSYQCDQSVNFPTPGSIFIYIISEKVWKHTCEVTLDISIENHSGFWKYPGYFDT